MVKIRDLIHTAMSAEDKAKLEADEAKVGKEMTDDEVAALPSSLDWLKKAKKGGD